MDGWMREVGGWVGLGVGAGAGVFGKMCGWWCVCVGGGVTAEADEAPKMHQTTHLPKFKMMTHLDGSYRLYSCSRRATSCSTNPPPYTGTCGSSAGMTHGSAPMWSSWPAHWGRIGGASRARRGVGGGLVRGWEWG